MLTLMETHHDAHRVADDRRNEREALSRGAYQRMEHGTWLDTLLLSAIAFLRNVLRRRRRRVRRPTKVTAKVCP